MDLFWIAFIQVINMKQIFVKFVCGQNKPIKPENIIKLHKVTVTHTNYTIWSWSIEAHISESPYMKIYTHELS